MEYFRVIPIKTSENNLNKHLTLNNLELISNEIFNLDTPSNETSNIGGIWGEFTLSRNTIKGGVRFALLECPNALSWTITNGFPPNPDAIIIHLTINRQTISQSFDEEINEFLEDHSLQLKSFFNTL